MLRAQPNSSSLAPKPEALLTRMSMPPSAAAAAPNSRHRSLVGEIADRGMSGAATGGDLLAAFRRARSAPRAQIDTAAPASAKASAIARPNPRLPPVTSRALAGKVDVHLLLSVACCSMRQ